MKRTNYFSTLASVFLAMVLLPGTSLVWAAEVCVEGDIATGVKGVEVSTTTYGDITVDVDFINATGFEIYGSDLSNMPFDGLYAEEDISKTLLAINTALSSVNPVPLFAELPGEQTYYIGVEGETEGPLELVIAQGAENATGLFWDPCTDFSGCFLSAATLQGDIRHVYADLTKADGTGCGDAPPPVFSVTPGISGSWYDVTREGEGFNIEIGGSTVDPYFLTYFYTYDASGNQMWLTGLSTIEGDTAVVPMTVTSGPVFGPGYDPTDVNYVPWGTITFKFSSCSAGTADYDSNNMGSGSFDLVHITGIAGVSFP